MTARTTRGSMTLAKQICELIPAHEVSKIPRHYKVDSRVFTPWSHVVSHIYGHVAHAIGLNDICDGLGLVVSWLRSIRGATPPKRNTLSNANRKRDCRVAKDLYWYMVDHLQKVEGGFAKRKIRNGYLRRFRAAIYAVDSTTIQLVANCMDWAKHRRRKAAAKCHMKPELACVIVA